MHIRNIYAHTTIRDEFRGRDKKSFSTSKALLKNDSTNLNSRNVKKLKNAIEERRTIIGKCKINANYGNLLLQY